MFSPIANLIIQGIYYVLVVIMSFFAVFSVYILIRFGEKFRLSVFVALVFAFFFFSLLIQSYSTLQGII